MGFTMACMLNCRSLTIEPTQPYVVVVCWLSITVPNILINVQIMTQNRYSRLKLSAILDRPIRKPDFWPIGLTRQLRFHLRTKFGAKMLIDAQITAQNRNSRWRPSAVLEFLCHHIGHPQNLFVGLHQPVKFCANLIHSFEDIKIWICCRNGLKCLFTHPNFLDP